MEDKEILRLEDVNKYYGDLHVLKDVNLEVDEGDAWVIIGPSGSGKSTLLYCVNALEPIQDGKIYFQGQSLEKFNTRQVRESIGIVFQQFNLFPHLDILDNITIAPRKVKGFSKRKSKEQAINLLRKVGLEHKKDSYPHELSGGQQQRVAIARALAMEPEIMLYDEVTSALDPELIHGVLQVMQDLLEEGMTSIIVTHEIPFARESADFCLFMEGGSVVERGPTKEVLVDPSKNRTKEFLDKVL